MELGTSKRWNSIIGLKIILKLKVKFFVKVLKVRVNLGNQRTS
jgi:hypothetical protein